MKKSSIIRLLIHLHCFYIAIMPANAQPAFELSTNIYRIPYEDGKAMKVRQDHFTHSPLGRYDFRAEGIDDCNTHRVVAAAAGVVRFKVESHDTSCGGCGASNNYVWIEHANDEWTKYTHFKKNSVVVNVNDTVCAGDFLGYECWVGSTSPSQFRHLHFEVRRPNNPAAPVIDPAGGFMNPGDGAHLIPVINSINKHYFEQNDIWTASASTSCGSTNIIVGARTIAANSIEIHTASNTIINDNAVVIYQNASNGLFHAGTSITLSPGFHAQAGTSFKARIGSCATTPFPGGCN